MYVPGVILLLTAIEKLANRELEDMEVVLNANVGPEGDTVAFRLTAPVKPLVRMTLMTVESEPPASIVKEAELADKTKSGVDDVMVTEIECDRDPLVPITVTA